MASKSEFAGRVREEIGRLRRLATDAASIDDATPDAREEAAEFLQEAIADCEDAIGSLDGTP